MNDFETLFPAIAKEWSPTNTETPSSFTSKCTKKFKWICPQCKNEYISAINQRVKGYGCPFCSSRKLKIGQNDFLHKYPEIAKEWDYSKNKDTPDNFFPNSRKKVFWICPKGHSYISNIHNRIHGVGCPQCQKERRTSFPEQAILFYLSKLTETENRPKINGFEIDIYIKKLSVGIEYDGIFFHDSDKAKIKEERKNKALKNLGIKLIRVKEIKREDESYVSNNIIYYSPSDSNYKNIGWVVNKLLGLLGFKEMNINVEKDSIDIKSNYLTLIKKNSIVARFPEIAKDWDYELNKNINPEFVSYQSNQKYYWKCPTCHQVYLATPSHKIRKNNGCPICSNHKIVVGINDFGKTHKIELIDWDYSKNIILPTNITYGTSKKVYWKCHLCGYEWRAMPNIKIKRGCPNCKKAELKKRFGKRVLNVETGIIYESLHDACSSVGKPKGVTPISNCCKGKRKSAYGYHWKFYNK